MTMTLMMGVPGFGKAVAIEPWQSKCQSEHAECPMFVVGGTGHPTNKATVFYCPGCV